MFLKGKIRLRSNKNPCYSIKQQTYVHQNPFIRALRIEDGTPLRRETPPLVTNIGRNNAK